MGRAIDRTATAAALAVGALAGCGGSGHVAPPPHVELRVTPRFASVLAPLHVRVSGLRPHERVELDDVWRGEGGSRARGRVVLRADAHGVATDESKRELWGMRGDSHFNPYAYGGNPVFVVARVEGTAVARAKVDRVVAPLSLRRRVLRVRSDGVTGVLVAPPGHRRRPGIVMLGGSEGGVPNVTGASALAAHGYEVLALAYFGAPGLPRTQRRIPLEYLRRGVRVLASQPHVEGDRVAIQGTSTGGELALLVAATYPHLVRAAVSLVGSSEVDPIAEFTSPVSWTRNGRIVAQGPIHIERFHGAVLAAGASGDRHWTSATYADDVGERLRGRRGRERPVVLTYYDAGHLIGFPVPGTPAFSLPAVGGTITADARARERLWPRLLRFLRTSLQR